MLQQNLDDDTQPDSHKMMKLSVVSSFQIAGMVVAVLLLGTCNSNKSTNVKKFDSEIWLANAGNEEKDNPRAEMISELIDEVLKVGMTRDEVIKLLGPPDSTRDTRELYDIGRSPWGVDLEYLAIDYEDDKLVLAFMLRG